MMENHFFESNYKKFGLLELDKNCYDEPNKDSYKPFIKILYLPIGYRLKVDFSSFETQKPSLFFIGSNQYFQIEKCGKESGYFVYYNRDFYCIQMHDAEVACDGLLFNNVYEMPMTELPENEVGIVKSLFEQIKEELEINATSQEEMIRTLLKQLIIRATRIWKKQQLGKLNDEPHVETDFFRDFSRLVEIHYREKHTVADYSDLIGVAPKTLSNKFKRFQLPQPNDIIKDRIMLEAKRMLNYSKMSVKEIAYDLGYEDPAYFNRLFTKKVGDSPTVFKKKFHSGKNVQV